MESERLMDYETVSHSEPRVVRTVSATIPAGEFLVYYFRWPENVRCDPAGTALNGQNEAGRLFASLDEARAYASEKAKDPGKVGTGVYDHKWKILAQFTS